MASPPGGPLCPPPPSPWGTPQPHGGACRARLGGERRVPLTCPVGTAAQCPTGTVGTGRVASWTRTRRLNGASGPECPCGAGPWAACAGAAAVVPAGGQWPGGQAGHKRCHGQALTALLCPHPVPQTLAAARAVGHSSCPRRRPVAYGVGSTREICFSKELIFCTLREAERLTEAFKRSRLMKCLIYSTRDDLWVRGSMLRAASGVDWV